MKNWPPRSNVVRRGSFKRTSRRSSALSAGVLHANERAARLPFTSWYERALLMLAVGLFGIMIQLSLGSVVNWLSRAAQ